jgi:hypothetical protein
VTQKADTPVIAIPAGPQPLGRSAPTKISIPAIGLRAPIDAMGLRPDGSVQTPSFKRANHAGWFRLGPSPGEPGAAVILGHVDTKKGAAVFYYLTRLRPGEAIEVVRADGSTAIFTIDSLEEFAKAAFPTDRVYLGSAEPALRLVTCGGRFDARERSYVDNIVVFARLTGVRPAAPAQTGSPPARETATMQREFPWPVQME